MYQRSRPIKQKIKSYLKFFVKLAISGAALYYVYQKIDVDKVLAEISTAHIGFLLLALLAFNASKVVAAFRLKEFYGATGLDISHKYNLRLYYIGMFYNMFLPGAIGGDGYKVVVLRKQPNANTKRLVWATLIDRVSGMAWLLILGFIFLLYSSFDAPFEWVYAVVIALTALVIPVYYLSIRLLFSYFLSVFTKTTVYSLIVQIGQAVCALMILYSLGVDDFFSDYLALFMVSSVVAIIPFTVGGVGARELVFLGGYEYLNISEGPALAFATLFFCTTAATALIGLVVSLTSQKA